MGLEFRWLFLVFVSASFTLEVAAGKADEPRPKYGPAATRLFHSREYVRKHDAPDFWALMPYYTAQRNDRSCSLASAVMVVNAARAHRALRADEPLVTQNVLLDRVDDAGWRSGVAADGNGVTLAQFGTLLERSLEVSGVTGVQVEMVHLSDPSAETKAALDTMLRDNEASDSDFVIANFLQSAFTGDPEGAVGHIAPVAAYDAENQRVLILDPDRVWYEPYWVSLDTFLAGMATKDQDAAKFRGYVRVRFER